MAGVIEGGRASALSIAKLSAAVMMMLDGEKWPRGGGFSLLGVSSVAVSKLCGVGIFTQPRGIKGPIISDLETVAEPRDSTDLGFEVAAIHLYSKTIWMCAAPKIEHSSQR